MSEYDNNYEDATVESVETDNTGYTQQQTYQTYATEPKGKAFAIVSMVCGIVSLFLICCSWFGLIVAITAIVFGILSIVKQESGKGMAIAGIICAAISAIVIIGLLIMVASLGITSSSDPQEIMRQLQNAFGN